jgi:integrin beta 3
MDRNDIAALAKGMVPFVREVVTEAVAPLVARLAELEARPTEKGDPGPAGDRGPPGDKGEKGDIGRDGRDAADLMLIYSHINEQVNETVVRAIKMMSFTSPDSGRTLCVGLGDKMHEIKTGIPLYAGMWKEGVAYNSGDGVSLDGSFWIAQAQTTTKPPSDDWRLAVRSGKNGKDYRPDDKPPPDKPIRFK